MDREGRRARLLVIACINSTSIHDDEVSGLHYKKRPVDLDEPAFMRLAQRILEVTRQTYNQAGLTNRADCISALVASLRSDPNNHLFIPLSLLLENIT